MAEWIYFIHPPRENFAETMTEAEEAVWAVHFERFQRMLAEGDLILVGPTLGPKNTGIAIFEAPDEETVAAALLGLAAQGNLRTETLRAFTAEEMGRVLQKLG